MKNIYKNDIVAKFLILYFILLYLLPIIGIIVVVFCAFLFNKKKKKDFFIDIFDKFTNLCKNFFTFFLNHSYCC